MTVCAPAERFKISAGISLYFLWHLCYDGIVERKGESDGQRSRRFFL